MTASENKVANVRATLLHRPPPPPGALARRDLLDALDAGLHCPATLVAAPAGYGKSVLASQWCEQLDRPIAWLSLAPPATGLRGFLGHLVAAIRSVDPEAPMAATVRLVDDGSEPGGETALTALSNDLSSLDRPSVVVLDDYHVVKSPAVHELMVELLRHPAPSVHFTTLTRHDPPWPISALRAAGRLHELRMDDLRFTPEESAELIGNELQRPLDDDEVAALDEATEGWAAGLRLAMHAVRHGASLDAVFGAGYLDRGTQEYLTGEVLDRLPPEMLPAMVVASHFDRFNAELFDAVLGGDDAVTVSGAEFISWVERENLFAIPLDEQRSWYRFHHVFGHLLREWSRTDRTRLALDEADLHRTAAQLCVERGDIVEAVAEYVEAGDVDAAIDIVATTGMELVDGDRWGELATLLDAVPADLSQHHAVVCVLRAWLAGEHGGRYREMSGYLDRAETLLDEHRDDEQRADDLRGNILVLRGTYGRHNGGDFAGGVDDARVALQHLSGTPGRVLTHAYALGAVSLANMGEYREARRFLDAAMDDGRFADSPIDPLHWARPLLAWAEGSMSTLERTGGGLVVMGERHEIPAFVVYGNYFLGISAYERNDLELARKHLTMAIDFDVAIVEFFLHSKIALAHIDIAAGQPLDALRTSESMLNTMIDTRGDYTKPTAEAAMALAEFRTGHEADALRWARATEFDLPRHRYMFFDRAPALIEILLSSEPDRPRGRELLDRALASQYGRCNRPVTIKLRTLAALDAARQDDLDGALHTLAGAVGLAREGGLIRSIADFGPELVGLLHRLDVDGADLAHVGAILGALDPLGESDGDVAGGVAISASVAGEPGLTGREVDVLRLLAQRCTNKEISQALTIAPATVKKHTVTLYDKLHVHGRREAVEKARVLGYITD